MIKKLSFIFLFALLSVNTTLAEELHTPATGSKERQLIISVLRTPVEKELKQKVIFRVDHLRVKGKWAFLLGVPLQANGKKIDYHGTPYQDAQEAFDDGICALLRLKGEDWSVVTYTIGATDVPYVEWDKEFGAPSDLVK